MPAKTKQTKTTTDNKNVSETKDSSNTKEVVVKSEQFDFKTFHTRVESLIQELMTYTLRGTSLEADIPADQEVVERLYEQIRDGYTTLAMVDDYCGVKVNELGKFMYKLTQSRHQHNMQAEVEAAPAIEDNIVNPNKEQEDDEEDDEEEDDKDNDVEESEEVVKPKKSSKSKESKEELPPKKQKKSKTVVETVSEPPVSETVENPDEEEPVKKPKTSKSAKSSEPVEVSEPEKTSKKKKK